MILQNIPKICHPIDTMQMSFVCLSPWASPAQCVCPIYTNKSLKYFTDRKIQRLKPDSTFYPFEWSTPHPSTPVSRCDSSHTITIISSSGHARPSAQCHILRILGHPATNHLFWWWGRPNNCWCFISGHPLTLPIHTNPPLVSSMGRGQCSCVFTASWPLALSRDQKELWMNSCWTGLFGSSSGVEENSGVEYGVWIRYLFQCSFIFSNF